MANYPATNNLADVVVTNPGPLEDSAKLSDAMLETRRVMVAVIEKQHDSFGNISPASVTAAMLAPGAVTSTTIVDQTITDNQIADGTITGASLANGTLSDTQIAPKGITSASIADATITEQQLAPNSVGTPELQNNSVTAAKLASGIDLSGTLAANTVPLNRLAPGSPGSAQILIVDQTLMPAAVVAASPSGDLTMDHTGKFTLATAPSSRMPIVIVSEVQAAGVTGQTLSVGLGPPPPVNQGGWNLRNLNTLLDPQSIASLSGNRVLLPSGTYLVDASAPANGVDYHQAILVQIPVTTASDPTTWTVLLVGTSEYTDDSVGYTTSSIIRGLVTLTAAAYVGVLHQVSHAGTGGISTSFAVPAVGIFPNIVGMPVDAYVSVYTQIQFLKVA